MRSLTCSVLLLAVNVAVPAAAAPTAVPEVLPFVENDYSAALSQARAKGVPLFVDVWAPW